MSALLRAGVTGLFLATTVTVFAASPSSRTDVPIRLINAEWDSDVVNPSCGTDSDCYDACEECCDCCPVWTVRVGAMQLQRVRGEPLPAIVPIPGPGVISSTADFAYSGSVAPEISIARRLVNYCGSVEVRYFGAVSNETDAAYGAVGDVRIGSFTNFGATNLTARGFSNLNNAELNWLRPTGEHFTLILGARAMGLHDDLTYNIVFPAFNADYNYNVDNYLWGGQIGGDWSLWDYGGPFRVNAVGKAAVFHNWADHDFTLLPSTGGVFDGGASGTQVAFLGDINITASYQLTSNFAVRAGYQVLWLEGVAVAPEQLAAATAASSQAVINTSGSLFYHGFTGGFELVW